MKQRLSFIPKINLFALLALVAATGTMLAFFVMRPATAAACATGQYGTASTTITVPANGQYRIWSRIMAPDTTNNTYQLEIDGNQCFTVGGGNVPANTWTWVDYQTGNAKITLSLNQGNHTIKMQGVQPNVAVDRIIAVSDLNCVPVDTGNNCDTPADATPPTINLTAPPEGGTVSGTTNLTADATDNTGVTKVEFYANSTLVGTDNAAPYSFGWNTASVVNGQYTITAKAYDAAGNTSSDGYRITVQNGDTQKPTAPTSVTASTPDPTKVVLTWKPSTDNVAVTGYSISRNGTKIGQVTGTTYQDTTVSANTSYNYQVTAFDAAGNQSDPSAVVSVKTPNVPDTTAPTTPTQLTATAVSSSQINLTWQASTDNSGAVSYDVYRAAKGGTAQKVATVASTSYGNTGLAHSTEYSYYVKAKDSAGNQSAASNTATAKTQNKQQHRRATIKGTVRSNGKPVRYAFIIVDVQNSRTRYIAVTDSQGRYTIPHLPAGRYSVNYHAFGYHSQTISMRLNQGEIKVQNVNLRKR